MPLRSPLRGVARFVQKQPGFRVFIVSLILCYPDLTNRKPRFGDAVGIYAVAPVLTTTVRDLPSEQWEHNLIAIYDRDASALPGDALMDIIPKTTLFIHNYSKLPMDSPSRKLP
jgi:hypothetical protein